MHLGRSMAVLFIILVPIAILFVVMEAPPSCDPVISKKQKTWATVLWSAAILSSGFAAWITCEERVLCCCRPLVDFALVNVFAMLSYLAFLHGMAWAGWGLYAAAVFFGAKDTLQTSGNGWWLTLPYLVWLGVLGYAYGKWFSEETPPTGQVCTSACAEFDDLKSSTK